MKRILKTLAVSIALALAAILVIWNREIATIFTIKPLESTDYVFQMDYKAPYDLDDIVNADADENSELVNYVIGKLAKGLPLGKTTEAGPQPMGCTSFQARNAEGDGYLYARNYDYFKSPTMIVRSSPKKGYKSISVCDLSHVGYSKEKLPDNFAKKALCLAMIYAPMDGINEKGLCTSIMALPNMPSQQDTPKHDIGTSMVMRLILDKCSNVDEALQLLDGVDIRHDLKAGSGYHYMIADAKGNCVVLEFDMNDGWKSTVIRKPEDKNYMVVTNHLLSPKYYTTEPDERFGNPHSKSWWRYATVDSLLSTKNGTVTPDEAYGILDEVHWDDLVWDNGIVETTQYSNVYDQDGLTLTFHPWENREKAFKFEL
jgi:Predicted choloylglycine hydrolase